MTALRLSLITILLASLAPVSTAEARLMRAWTYGALFKESTLVVIAQPVKTTTLKKIGTLPGISTRDAAGNVKPVRARIVETDFVVVGVLRGKSTVKKLTLRHFKPLAPNAPMVNGPGFVSFDVAKKRQYLMFLERAADGRYVATSGQTDPDQSIEVLQHSGR